jgi:prepilin-type N-terminal cleavage/methylation domain-containing protein
MTHPLRATIMRSDRHCQNAFTLIELLVVVAIIALLIGILIPSFKAVTRSAKTVSAVARINVLERGLESYRNEPALGGVYPPSQTDDQTNFTTVVSMENPLNIPGQPATVDFVTGANLLAYGMVGADRLGTPGFRDLPSDADDFWFNNMSAVPEDLDLYDLNPSTGEPIHPRFPGTGSTFVDEPTAATIRSLNELDEDGLIATDVSDFDGTGAPDQLFFTDPWGYPILYYRANKAARSMVSEPTQGTVGVYDQRDNGFFTGSVLLNRPGIDFGAGTVDPDFGTFSAIGRTSNPPIIPEYTPDNINKIVGAPEFANTLERFIYNRKITQRNEPVNRNTFLLISAGPDAIYGTTDDVVNWTRDEE